jgi:hypothetical protein
VEEGGRRREFGRKQSAMGENKALLPLPFHFLAAVREIYGDEEGAGCHSCCWGPSMAPRLNQTRRGMGMGMEEHWGESQNSRRLERRGWGRGLCINAEAGQKTQRMTRVIKRYDNHKMGVNYWHREEQ